MIASAQEVIARVQALLEDNEQILTSEKKKMEELEATRGKVQQELNAETSELETLRAKLATKKLLTEEELRKALAEVEETRQRNIQEFKEQIKWTEFPMLLISQVTSKTSLGIKEVCTSSVRNLSGD